MRCRRPNDIPLGHRQVAIDPGDDFNRRATWPTILEPAGWHHVYDRGAVAHWRRPARSAVVHRRRPISPARTCCTCSPAERRSEWSPVQRVRGVHDPESRWRLPTAARTSLQRLGRNTGVTVAAASIEGDTPHITEPAAVLTLTPLSVLLGEPDEAVQYSSPIALPPGVSISLRANRRPGNRRSLGRSRSR